MRKYIIAIIGLVAFIATIGLVTAGYGPGIGECEQKSFIDENGDGICDNWVDDDGDGVNDNCLMDGSGNQYRYRGEQGNRNGPVTGLGHSGIGSLYGKGYGPGNRNCA
jgi:hypothetical protein